MEDAYPIQIVKFNDTDHSFSSNLIRLKEILLRDDIKDRSVVVVSVAGAFRKGKSFLLNFFLRYLYAQYRKKDVSNWLGRDDEPLNGFKWGGGSKGITTGITMWSDVFTMDYKNGDKIAIILLDTQGNFGAGSTVGDWSLIFALSTLVSSVQCFNVKDTIQEDDLMHLNLFTEFGRLAHEDTDHRPFQRLQFIVRDWSFPYEYEYGSKDGEALLDRLFKAKYLQQESRMLREQISGCFDEVGCFLLPYPGKIVTTNSTFDGSLKDIDHEFKTSLNDLVPMLLAPENLLPKKINGNIVKAHEFVELFPIFLDALQAENYFNAMSIYMYFAEFQNTKAVTEAELLYGQLMDELCSLDSIDENKLLIKHRESKDKAIQKFRRMPKSGTIDCIKDFMAKLDASLERLYKSYHKANKVKQEAEWKKTKENIYRTGLAGLAIVGTVASTVLSILLL